MGTSSLPFLQDNTDLQVGSPVLRDPHFQKVHSTVKSWIFVKKGEFLLTNRQSWSIVWST
jgi:hypothetical protein